MGNLVWRIYFRESRDPRKRFESSAWERRIEQYRMLGKDKKARFVAKENFRK